MVIADRIRRFGAEDDGVTFVEALLTLPIMMILMAAMIECGAVLWQWNQTVKAMQLGARLVAVSSPLVSDAAWDTLTADYGSLQGGPVPAATPSVSCGAGTTACDAAGMARLLGGHDSVCGTTERGTFVGMCDVANVTADEIRVTYIRAGLGYIGRPAGPVVQVKLELVNKSMDFFVLDRIIPILGRMQFPPHTVSITSEDLNDCKDTCP